MPDRRWCHGGAKVAAAAGLLLVGCRGAGPGHVSAAPITAKTSVTAPTDDVVTPTVSTVPATPVPSWTTTAPAVTDAPTTITGLTVPALAGAGPASQAIVVSAAAYGRTTATLTAYQRAGAGWRTSFGPWTADIGNRGFAPPGAKREGDGRTPSGLYGFAFFFGVDANPGVRFSYRQVAGTQDVWDDDPASPLYNEWVDSSRQNPGAQPEPMDNLPVYAYGAVIGYNSRRTRGLGSAIFLHVSDGGSTLGCVSLPSPELLALLRWLDPAQRPMIAMGVYS